MLSVTSHRLAVPALGEQISVSSVCICSLHTHNQPEAAAKMKTRAEIYHSIRHHSVPATGETPARCGAMLCAPFHPTASPTAPLAPSATASHLRTIETAMQLCARPGCDRARLGSMYITTPTHHCQPMMCIGSVCQRKSSQVKVPGLKVARLGPSDRKEGLASAGWVGW